MQQYIVIPELCAIIRKIAPEGNHIAPFGSADIAVTNFNALVSGRVSEWTYCWLETYRRVGIRSKENT
jgi:hypothetical protein